MSYDTQGLQRYFDGFAEKEWARLEHNLQGRNNYAVHKRFLDEHVRPGMRVLDIGSGPGRFAIDLVSMGAKVTVADLSQVQLVLARQRLAEHGLADKVESFRQLDVVHLDELESSSFDAVVCYGGVLSYTREHHVQAIDELKRVVRPGGVVLASVMSLYGTLRLLGPLDAAGVQESVDRHMDWSAVLNGAQLVYTRLDSAEFHQPIGLFTSRALRGAFERAGLEVLTLASSNCIIPQFQALPNFSASPVASRMIEELEVAVCDHPGLVDAGGHLLAVARRPV
jgi:2-polyprenyl-3-methyl-5-hydroxy-6-metoxy-1,4-benzoquinol methylase